MKLKCFWEHKGDDTLLYSIDYLGAFTRGSSLEVAKKKMPNEILSYALWSGLPRCEKQFDVEISEEKASDLDICDADSDGIFNTEKVPFTIREYEFLKELSLKSAADFLTLYNAIPNKSISYLPERKTFYGMAPRTANEMYEHTKNVNSYYFGEIGIDCSNDGDILSCRKRGFKCVEMQSDFLQNKIFVGSYGEVWSLKKVIRRFIWHDRIHAKAMYRMAVKMFEGFNIPNIFCFDKV